MKLTKDRLPGLFITVIFSVAALVLFSFIAWTRLMPGLYLLGIAILLIVPAVIIALLVKTTQHKVRFTVGTILALLFLAVFAFGGRYLFITVDALNKISDIKTKITEVSVFVRTDDPAESLSDTSEYRFGILAGLDRSNTDETVRQINEELGTTIQTAEYDGLTQLVDALLEGETDAIILNHAYLDVIIEIEGYEDLEQNIREITIKKVEQPIQTDSRPLETKSDHVYTIYISGSDTRGGLYTVGRSDVNILAVINIDTRQILLVSTPRDYYVPLSISGGIPDKLTHAGIYGVDVSMDTIGMLYDIDIDYYFRVNFTGFVDIIDALGGVTVYSDVAFDTGSYHFEQGANKLNGTQALAFSRERYAFADGDRQRGKNQMAVISAVINKALSRDLLTNYSSVLSSVEGCFEMSVPYEDIAMLVRRQLSDGGFWNIVRYSVDGTGDSQIPYSMSQYAYVMVPDVSTVEKAKQLIRQVYDGESISLN